MKAPVTKSDVLLAYANVILRLGKGDVPQTRIQIGIANATFEQWVKDRPEKKLVEKHYPKPV